jgi:hypothetical protein
MRTSDGDVRLMPRQREAELSAGPLEMFAGRRLTAAQGLGDLVVGQFFESTQHDGHGLTAGKPPDGGQDFLAQLCVGQLLQRQRDAVGGVTGRMIRFDVSSIAGSAPGHVKRGVDADFQDERLRTGMASNSIPSLPQNDQRILHCIFGIVGIPSDPPNRADHAVLERTDDLLVGLGLIVHQRILCDRVSRGFVMRSVLLE